MSKRLIDLCLVDPAKVAKVDSATQHALIALIQKAGVGLHIMNEFERFIAFYHALDCADLDEAAKFNFSDESIINLPPLNESPEYEPFWRLVSIAYDRISQQDQGTCLLYTSPSPRDRTRSRMPSSA